MRLEIFFSNYMAYFETYVDIGVVTLKSKVKIVKMENA